MFSRCYACGRLSGPALCPIFLCLGLIELFSLGLFSWPLKQTLELVGSKKRKENCSKFFRRKWVCPCSCITERACHRFKTTTSAFNLIIIAEIFFPMLYILEVSTRDETLLWNVPKYLNSLQIEVVPLTRGIYSHIWTHASCILRSQGLS